MLKDYVFTLVVTRGHPDLARAMAPAVSSRGTHLATFKHATVRILVNDKNCKRPVTQFLMFPGLQSFVYFSDKLGLGTLATDLKDPGVVSDYKKLSWLLYLKHAGCVRGLNVETLVGNMLEERLWGSQTLSLLVHLIMRE